MFVKNGSFEDLHPNHKWAFIDGLLCGVILTYFFRPRMNRNKKRR